MNLASPPPRSTYRFVLRETIHNPETSQAFTSYDEAADSRCIAHPDDVVACTLFLWSEHARDRATKLGWVDVTASWLAALDGEGLGPGGAAAGAQEAAGEPVQPSRTLSRRRAG